MNKAKSIVSMITMFSSVFACAGQVAITIDDPHVLETPLFTAKQRDEKIRGWLKTEKLKAALFVCGMRIDSANGRELLKLWDKDGHILSNHSYSHKDYNSAKISYDFFAEDLKRGELLISKLTNFRKFFRFPFLKEGETADKRDRMRELLKNLDYEIGAVTIDASDWYIDDRLLTRLEKNPSANLLPYRDFYLKHIWQRALYYDDLARKVTGRNIKHTLLIHHSLLTALFLGDLIQMFRSKNWKVIDASEAFQDPIFTERPKIIPAGESLVWALAKESGNFEGKLRYPGEDSVYEKEAMDKAGL